ncbi:MAG: hypothetical protein N2749_00385 [Clostridia bacterium]|nr:hypothetical protein [Clostridia bacterium]
MKKLFFQMMLQVAMFLTVVFVGARLCRVLHLSVINNVISSFESLLFVAIVIVSGSWLLDKLQIQIRIKAEQIKTMFSYSGKRRLQFSKKMVKREKEIHVAN